MAASPTYGEQPRPTGWTGWIELACAMLVLLGLARAIEGPIDDMRPEVAP